MERQQRIWRQWVIVAFVVASFVLVYLFAGLLVKKIFTDKELQNKKTELFNNAHCITFTGDVEKNYITGWGLAIVIGVLFLDLFIMFFLPAFEMMHVEDPDYTRILDFA